MQLNPHLAFNGNCEEAFRFYEKCLRGKIEFILTYGDSPAASKMPSAFGKRIIHASLVVAEQRLTGADTPNYEEPRGISILLSVNDAAEADRIFKELAEGATIRMAMQETFWAVRFGMLTDRFAIPWMINCGKPA